jgi:hypothetical protein
MGSQKKTDTERLRDADEVIRLRGREITELKASLRANIRHNDTVEETRKVIYGLKEIDATPPTWAVRERAAKSSGIPVAPLGDIHMGQAIALEQTGGVNEWNSKVAPVRIRRWVETVCDLCFNHMTHPEYPGIIVPLMGDLISGFIHEELRETNWEPVQVSCRRVQSYVAWSLGVLADRFGKVWVPCVVGNHGRSTHRPRYINRQHESYEWVIYHNLRDYFKADPRLKFYIPDEPDAFFSVFGTKIMMTHGDAIGAKGGDGMIGALGPIKRGEIKIGNAERHIGRDFDYLLIGHYHSAQPAGALFPVIVNGCVCGFDNYARLALRVPFSRPTQMLCFFHQKYGLTTQWAVYLDAKKSYAPAEEWVTWQDRRGGKEQFSI